MSRTLFTAIEDTPVCDICEMMFQHNLHRIPILREGKVVGLVTAMDVIRTVADGVQV